MTLIVGFCDVTMCRILDGTQCIRGHAVAQLVEALLYKPVGRGFDSR
jgi:hypothetical protein